MCAADRSTTTLVGVGGVVEPADEVVGGGEEQLAGDGVDDRGRRPDR